MLNYFLDTKRGDVVYGASLNALTAKAGGGRTGATQLSPSQLGVNRISVCATSGDSVQLPAATVGQECFVVNDGAAACRVFAQEGTSDTIDGVAAATGVVITNPKRVLFKAVADGVWLSLAGVATT